MTQALEAVNNLISRLYLDHGIFVACVGGAARDVFLGREPKDYDFVILKHPEYQALYDDMEHALAEAIGMYPRDLSGNGNGSEGTSDSNGDALERGLEKVWETDSFDGMPIKFQFLLYTAQKIAQFECDPAKAVYEHDCSLNHGWLAKNLAGGIVARVTDEFPNPATGNKNYFRADTNPERRAYIRNKFPEFNHQ